MSIESKNITQDLSPALRDTGIEIHDYVLNGVVVDYETLAVRISKQRASAVEKEIPPLSTKMRRRNASLDKLGTMLSLYSGYQKNFKGDDPGTKPCTISKEARNLYNDYFHTDPPGYANDQITNSGLAEAIQRIKSEIDKLNNEAQLDMNRLQDLVTKRDDSFTNATDIMKTISGTRDTTLATI